ncbi:MAG: AAA family ATPase [Phycisphaeraceae bacterium]|nr:AAA family ATPase [Phycisphaeraceae bacterium]MBX3368443.1 AAA family ATPase [Phycisphaeraceae bacterium]QYK49019.1 MAG: AAA family ATPase [Phycisphaeraceae bacterium]
MHDAIERLRRNIGTVFLGNPGAIDAAICCLLARGHLLIEDVPGVGKTILASAIARSVECSFSRIQLTPDMMPTDVLGVSIYEKDSGQFVFKPGAIFANIVLADEINRTTPRTQTALLEAMNEGSVSVDGRALTLDQPFMVIATQNPYEFEGTYLLPENQLDRFLMRIDVGYPSPADEARVIELRPASTPLHDLRPIMHKEDVIRLQQAVDAVRLDRTLVDYIVSLANATRRHEAAQVGLSPRGSLALAQAARAAALIDGRDYVIPEDITSNIFRVCAHRVIPRAAVAETEGHASRRILEDSIRAVASPL